MKHRTTSRCERCLDVSVIRLHDTINERRDNVSRVCKDNIPLLCLILVSNETLNDVSLVRRQDVLVLRLLDVIRKRRDYVLGVRNYNASWYVSTTP